MTLLASRSDLAKELGISKATFSRYQRLGIVPPPVKGTARYLRSEVLAALRGKPDATPAVQLPALSPLEEWKMSRGR